MHDLPLKRPTYRGRSRNSTPHFPSFVRSEQKLNIAWLPVRCNSCNSDTVSVLDDRLREDRVYQSPSLKTHMSS
ncbi:Transcriptional activator protein acu-15 [Fusarium oxysporum f. sp. albedinis]|nr:Transcriptional activator protein acu-15 [Fusarium oxysporum f. sp. albedinis]